MTREFTYRVVIPARYYSERLPGKPLKSILGKPMIQHVYEKALSSSASEVIIATDHKAIEQAATSFGATVVMTSQHHTNGTERIAEVARLMGWPKEQVVVNLQGDEPLMPVTLIEQVANNLSQRPDAGIASLATPIHKVSDVFDPNVVKALLDHQGFAMMFSRAPLPWYRAGFLNTSHSNTSSSYPNTSSSCPNSSYPISNCSDSSCLDSTYGAKENSIDPVPCLPDGFQVLRHIGLYAYRVGFLQAYTQQLAPSALEQIEALEQLRALYYGVKIHLDVIKDPPASGVDTQADLDQVIEHLLESID